MSPLHRKCALDGKECESSGGLTAKCMASDLDKGPRQE